MGLQFVNAVLSIIPAIFLFLIAIHYLPMMYSDMFTSKRVSVAHRRFLPEKSVVYKSVVGWTSTCVVSFTINRIMMCVRYLSPLNGPICSTPAFVSVAGWFQQIAKFSMFMIFLLRLEMVFSGSLYEYRRKVLKCWAVFFACYSAVFMAVTVLLYISYKNPCVVEQTSMLMIIAAMVLIQDIVFSIGFLVSFMRPLKKLLRLVEMTTERRNEAEMAEADKNSGKFYYIAVKVTILTAVAAISTILSVIISVPATLDLFGIDGLINSICVVLMTPYYQDGRYYQKLCYCCVRLCTPRGKRYLSRVRQNSKGTYDSSIRTGDEKYNISVDTADQVNHATRNHAPDKENPEMNVVKSAESEVDVNKTDAEIVYQNK